MLNLRRTFFFLFVLSFGSVYLVNAQVKITPLIKYKSYKPTPKGSNLRTLATPLLLPFFDDFSTTADSIDFTLWERTGGTQLNNSKALNPPSINVVTFDGADSSGRPYNGFVNPLATGEADILTSNPIDLSTYDSTSGVFLSFLWQAEGLGEEPDHATTDDDFITLYFFNKDSAWTSVWTQEGGSVQDFRNAIIPVKDSLYFWSGFQFRLISNGNLSGGFDNWHLDYFYLNSARNEADTFYNDLAISKHSLSFLKRYYAMPYQQYKANPQAETADSLSVLAYNLDVDPLKPDPSVIILKDAQAVLNLKLGSENINPHSYKTYAQPFDYRTIIGEDSVNADINQTRQFRLEYDLLEIEGQYRGNDKHGADIELKDYFAYDDGSAEAAFNLTGINAKLAYRYHLNQPDTLTAIHIYYPPQIRDISGTGLRLLIWNHKEDSVYKRISTVAVYTDTINEFVKYALTGEDQLVLSDTFYIGYEQTVIDPLPIGFDRNTNSNSEIFYQLGGEKTWARFSDEEGSLMIRPVFGRAQSITSDDNPVTVKSYKLFPNPSKGTFTIDGDIDKVSVYDHLGRAIQEKTFKKGEKKELKLNNSGNGLYILHLFKGKNRFIEKIILDRNF